MWGEKGRRGIQLGSMQGKTRVERKTRVGRCPCPRSSLRLVCRIRMTTRRLCRGWGRWLLSQHLSLHPP